MEQDPRRCLRDIGDARLRDDALVALPTAEGEERVLATGFSKLIESRWLPDGLHVLVAGTDPDGRFLAAATASGEIPIVSLDGGSYLVKGLR